MRGITRNSSVIHATSDAFGGRKLLFICFIIGRNLSAQIGRNCRREDSLLLSSYTATSNIWYPVANYVQSGG